MDYIKVIFLFLFGVLVLTIEAKRKKRIRIDFFSYFLIFYGLMYFFPIILWFLTQNNRVWWSYRFGIESGGSWIVISALVVAFFSVHFGYNAAVSRRREEVSVEKKTNKLIFKHLLIFTVLYLTLLIISIYSKGGVREYIINGILSRGVGGDSGVAAYFRYFLVGGELAVVLWLGLAMELKKSYILKILSAFTFCASIIVALSTGSRAAVIYPLMFVFIFFYGIGRRRLVLKNHLALIALVIVAFYAIGVGGEFYYNYARYHDNDIFDGFNFNEKILAIPAYFQHYLITIDQAINNPDVYQLPRLWIDYPRALLDALPGYGWEDGSVDAFGYTSMIAEINKKYLYGDGFVPPGWIGAALINGWFFGLILQGFFAGWIGGRLNNIILGSSEAPLRPYKFAVMVVAMTAWYRIFFAQDPWQVVLANFGLYLLLFFVFQTVSLRRDR